MQKTIKLLNKILKHKLNYVTMDNLIESSKTSWDFSRIINQIKFPFKTLWIWSNIYVVFVLSVYDLIMIFQRHFL